MNEIIETTERPISITVICVIGFIGALMAVPLIFSSIAQQIGFGYQLYRPFVLHGPSLHDRIMDDEKMGCLYLYRSCSAQPDRFSCYGNMEYHGSACASSCYILRI
jgi:hypothetical protein